MYKLNYKTMFSDFHTPISVLYKLKQHHQQVFLLESVDSGEKWGRYSYLGFNPKTTIRLTNKLLYVNNELTTKPIQEVITTALSDYQKPSNSNLPLFTGGLVGYFAYDSVSYFESSISINSVKDIDNDDVLLLLFDKVIAFDHLQKKIYLIENIEHKEDSELEELEQLINSNIPYKFTETKVSNFVSNTTEEQFCNNVLEAKRRIYEGDIFQVVLSQRLSATIQGDLFNTYRNLRTINPSPYMYYFNYNDLEVAGASPETLVKVENNVVTTFPIAGTRRRGKSNEEDIALEKELLLDEKELAEHNMLVDLGRNDCGKVCEFGSVEVKDYMKIERFSKVMHITSKVEGILQKNLLSIDALASILPAGTLSGAPKIMACNIIDSLESKRRGLYGGAIGYIDFDLNLDMCITIRTAIKKGNKVHVQAGAGIVYDSVPINEYNECLYKASAMIESIKNCNKVGE